MTITEKYIAKILPYLDEEVETEIINEIDKENEDAIAPELYFTAVDTVKLLSVVDKGI